MHAMPNLWICTRSDWSAWPRPVQDFPRMSTSIWRFLAATTSHTNARTVVVYMRWRAYAKPKEQRHPTSCLVSTCTSWLTLLCGLTRKQMRRSCTASMSSSCKSWLPLRLPGTAGKGYSFSSCRYVWFLLVLGTLSLHVFCCYVLLGITFLPGQVYFFNLFPRPNWSKKC
jgi:hypothetical protein